MSEHMCGPRYAKEYFKGVRETIAATGAKSRYFISCVDHETDILGVNFTTAVGVTTSSDGGLVTSFVDRETIRERPDLLPYKWLGEVPIAFIDSHVSPVADYDGPSAHPELFRAILALAAEHQEDARKYALVSRKFYTQALQMSGDRDVAEGAIRDGKVYHIVKTGDAVPAACECCTWDDETGDCNGVWCDE